MMFTILKFMCIIAHLVGCVLLKVTLDPAATLIKALTSSTCPTATLVECLSRHKPGMILIKKKSLDTKTHSELYFELVWSSG